MTPLGLVIALCVVSLLLSAIAAATREVAYSSVAVGFAVMACVISLAQMFGGAR